MKKAKQRVIALDYFRGFFILVVVINHAAAFSFPFAYLAGASGLWTSAAEMFMMISGITMSIVRGADTQPDFWRVAKKIWRRAIFIYVLDIATVFLSLVLALFLTSHGLHNGVLGEISQRSGMSLLWSIVNLSYSIGWASFLSYFAVFLVFTPFILYILRTRYWFLVPAASISVFLLTSSPLSPPGTWGLYAIWQLYFILGLTLGRFRMPILGWYTGLRQSISSLISKAILLATTSVLAISILADFNLYPTVASLTAARWLPHKAEHVYARLLSHKPTLDLLFIDARAGVLRPLVSVLFLGCLYMLYRAHKDFLLRWTGKFINTLGRNTLWIFVAQAVAIPCLAAIPISRNIFTNFIMTSVLISLMWLVANRNRMWASTKSYAENLKVSYTEAKYSYLQKYEETS